MVEPSSGILERRDWGTSAEPCHGRPPMGRPSSLDQSTRVVVPEVSVMRHTVSSFPPRIWSLE